MHNPRQVFQPRHLDRPFHQRLGHRYQRAIQHGLHQAVALFLLARGQDHRRAGEARIEQRPHRIPQPGRDMDIAGNETAGGAAKTVGDGDDKAFLHRHHISEIGMILQRVHDRQLGGAGVAEQVRDALVLEQCKERRAPGDAIHESPPLPAAVTVGIYASWLIPDGEIKQARSWLPCVAPFSPIVLRSPLQNSPS